MRVPHGFPFGLTDLAVSCKAAPSTAQPAGPGARRRPSTDSGPGLTEHQDAVRADLTAAPPSWAALSLLRSSKSAREPTDTERPGAEPLGTNVAGDAIPARAIRICGAASNVALLTLAREIRGTFCACSDSAVSRAFTLLRWCTVIVARAFGCAEAAATNATSWALRVLSALRWRGADPVRRSATVFVRQTRPLTEPQCR